VGQSAYGGSDGAHHKRRNLVLKLALITIASLAVHPGHGTGDGFSLLHYLTEPSHLLGGVVFVLVAAVAVALLRRRGQLRAARTTR
jgi:putative Mn2+ efflux pump MntP